MYIHLVPFIASIFLRGVVKGVIAGEPINVYVGKVGPLKNNPSEAYEYYSLPFCVPVSGGWGEVVQTGGGIIPLPAWRPRTFAERLGGRRVRPLGPSNLTPMDNGRRWMNCTTPPLTGEQVAEFGVAVRQNWYFEWYVEDLPVWGKVGKGRPERLNAPERSASGESLRAKRPSVRKPITSEAIIQPPNEERADVRFVPFIYTSHRLLVMCNGNDIVKADLIMEESSLQEIKAGIQLNFTLMVATRQSTEAHALRFDRYVDHNFFNHPVRWYSTVNSFWVAVFCTALVALVARTVTRRSWVAAAGRSDTEDRAPLLEEAQRMERGIHLRAPDHLSSLAALLGNGSQLAVVIFLFSLLGAVGYIGNSRAPQGGGKMLELLVFTYLATFPIAGYVAGRFHRKHAPDGPFTKCLALTALMLPATIAVIWGGLNILSHHKRSVFAVPWSAMSTLFAMWLLVSAPLCAMCFVLGRHSKLGGGNHSSGGQSISFLLNTLSSRKNRRTERFCRNYPTRSTVLMLLTSGSLQFGSIYVELYFVQTSLWGNKWYQSYHFLLVHYLILLLISAGFSIITVFLRLNAGQGWQWYSFGSGASIFVYIELYATYYFLRKTQMTGWYQAAMYGGTMTVLALATALSCGAVSHVAASMLVGALYRLAKLN